MPRLSSFERSVLQYAGIPAAQVAAVLMVDVGQVLRARNRFGRNGDDGQPGKAATVPPPRESDSELAAMMRSNRGVL